MTPEELRRSYLSHTGRVIDIWQMGADDVCLADVSHALALSNRFGGHTRQPYSVAQHSVNVMRTMRLMLDTGWMPCSSRVIDEIVDRLGYDEDRADSVPSLLQQALAHDFTEAYLQDLIRPVKRTVKGYMEIEDRVWKGAIAPHLGLPDMLHPLVIVADNAMLLLERDILTSYNPEDKYHKDVWGDLDQKYKRSEISPAFVRPLSWSNAKARLCQEIVNHFPEQAKADRFRQESWAVPTI